MPHSSSHPADQVSITFAAAGALGYLFARDATAWRATADEVAESAIRAGIQLRSDIEVARAIGLGVANRSDRARPLRRPRRARSLTASPASANNVPLNLANAGPSDG
jgi:hypothetical protein